MRKLAEIIGSLQMLRLSPLRGQNQLVRLRQSQSVNPTVMVNFYFPHLLQKVLASYSHSGNFACIALIGPGSADPGRFLHRNSGHHYLSVNENNSYLDYCRIKPGAQDFFMPDKDKDGENADVRRQPRFYGARK